MTKNKCKQSTAAVRAGVDEDSAHGAIMPPLYLSSNYSFAGYNDKRPYDYTRSGNPTRDDLAGALAALEGGAGCVVTATGMAALHLVFQLLSPGDLLLAPHDCYGGTHRLLESLNEKGHFEVAFVDQTNEKALRESFARKPKLILIETPSNPLLRITDVALVTSLAKEAGCLVAADNTFMSPILQQPLAQGADIVLHSTTKYINGHSDVVGGAVIAATKELHTQLEWWANNIGATGAPFDSYLTLRGLRTLDVRIKQQQKTAQALAEFLAGRDEVETVYYPGLETHAGHALAKKQQCGFGAMLSFALKGGEKEVKSFIDALDLFSLAESLGGFESLIAHPATMTHAAMDQAARKNAGIGDNLLRVSVGLEDIDDLLSALQNAFDALQKTAAAAA